MTVRKYAELEALPRTKRAFRRALHEAWTRGVWAAQSRLESEAERTESRDYRAAWSLREAAEMLDGVVARGR